MMRRKRFLSLSSLSALLHLIGLGFAAAEGPTVHTVIATDCTQYFTWQTIGLVFSIRKAGHSGPVTRLVSCTTEEYEKWPEADRDLDLGADVATHVSPSYSPHPRTHDEYAGINKPIAVIDWLAKTDVKEEYVLVIDADMIMRHPVLPQDLGAAPGTAVAGFFGYMKGVDNELALRHVPEVEPRMDSLAGPPGRRGDQVGGFTLMQREDLRRVLPLWIKYSEDVRFDPEAWHLTGDVFAQEGERPWIAEMYGYSFGCSKAGVWHVTPEYVMMYPGYEPRTGLYRQDLPKVLHYGILWHVNGTGYSFDKHWHYGFDALACPPWDMSTNPVESKRGLFAHPPRPSSLTTTGDDLYRDLLAIEPVVTLNEAFCQRHRKLCPPSEELERECGIAESIARELEEAFALLPAAAAGTAGNQGAAAAAVPASPGPRAESDAAAATAAAARAQAAAARAEAAAARAEAAAARAVAAAARAAAAAAERHVKPLGEQHEEL